MNEQTTQIAKETTEVVDVLGDTTEVVELKNANTETVDAMTDEEFAAEFEKRTGRKFGVQDEPKPVEKTEEEKKAELTQNEKALLSKFIDDGGTIEQFAQLKQIANADVKEFSVADIKLELKLAGFTEIEADEEIKRRYYLLSDEEKAEISEDDKETLRKHEYYSKKLASRGAYKIEQAKRVLQQYQNKINEESLLEKVDNEIASNVDTIAKNFQRKLVVELGEANGQKIPPIEYNITEEMVNEISQTLKNKESRNNLLYNKDGIENVENLFEILKWKHIAKDLALKSHLKGATEQVEIYQSKFGGTPQSVAPGSFPRQGNGQVGKTLSADVKKYN